ncbi:MAG: uracil-DNA glycosylase [Candidatus Izimaplasma sp.]|nr:uracil-DNA glycosylase [Candidatus Izimaplasma bacterium]
MITKNDWDYLLNEEMHQPYFKRLMHSVDIEYNNFICYPEKENIYKALKLTPFNETKVLILGQDPYHQKGQAMGLAFSVKKGVPLPPSLRNIYKELNNDLGFEIAKHGDLTSWSRQGVLLLNAILTVRENEPLSHRDLGWERLTDKIISLLNNKETPIVFVLWGRFARNKKSLITNKRHLIIENVHPSPLSAYRGFFGSKPFSKINNFLEKNNHKIIDFEIR